AVVQAEAHLPLGTRGPRFEPVLLAVDESVEWVEEHCLNAGQRLPLVERFRLSIQVAKNWDQEALGLSGSRAGADNCRALLPVLAKHQDLPGSHLMRVGLPRRWKAFFCQMCWRRVHRLNQSRADVVQGLELLLLRLPVEERLKHGWSEKRPRLSRRSAQSAM